MKRSTMFSAIGLTLIVLGVGMSLNWFSHVEKNATTSAIDQPSIAPTQRAQVSPDTFTMHSNNSRHLNSTDSNLAETAQPKNSESIKSEVVTPVSEKTHDDTLATDRYEEAASNDSSGSSSGTSESLDSNVIGRSIAISNSVKSDCKKQIDQPGDGMPCDYLLPLLSRIAQQPRDKTWAATTEALLRDYISTGHGREFTIRTLECRQSFCVAEVASLQGTLPLDDRWGGNQYLGQNLWPHNAYIGIEPDPSGNGAVYGTELKVTVEVFERREKNRGQTMF